MAHQFAETPLKTVRSQDGKIYYIINGSTPSGFAQVKYVDFYSTLFQIPNNERADNVLYFVENAAVHQGGDNDGDPRVKYGWAVYLWHVPKQRYYLVAQQSGEDYVVKGDLDAYLLKQVFNEFLTRYTTTIGDIVNVNKDQTFWIEWLRSRVSDVGSSLHAHKNLDTLDRLSSNNGILYFDNKAIGGNSYVYDVRGEDNKIYWQNPCNPLEVNYQINTVQEIVERFLSCPLARPGLTLYILDDDDNIAVYRIGVAKRIPGRTSVIDYTFEGGKLHTQSKIYFLYENGEYHELKTPELAEEEKYNIDNYKKLLTKYSYNPLGLAADTKAPTVWPAAWTGLDIVLKQQDGTYIQISSIGKLREYNLIAAKKDDVSGDEYWTEAASDLYQRVLVSSVTKMIPTLGVNTNEELDEYGDYLKPGTMIYSGVTRSVRLDAFRLEAIYEQTISKKNYGTTSRCDYLPEPSQRYHQQGLWSPLLTTEAYPAGHLYKCLPDESTISYEPTNMRLAPTDSTAGYDPTKAWFRRDLATNEFVRIYEAEVEAAYAEYREAERTNAEDEHIVICVDWEIFTCNPSYERWYWKDMTAQLSESIELPGAKFLTSFCVDETMWKKYGLLYTDPDRVYVDKNTGLVHVFGKTVIVRKFGSAPEHVGDGVVIWSSDRRRTTETTELIWDTVPATPEQVFYRAFSFSTANAPFKPTEESTVEPKPYSWDDIKQLGDNNLLSKVFSVGDTLILPEHRVYGQIPVQILSIDRKTINSKTKEYMLVATADVLPRKEFSPKTFSLVPVTGNGVNGKTYYQPVTTGGKTIYVPVVFGTDVTDVSGLMQKSGEQEGSARFANSRLREWLNATSEVWYMTQAEVAPTYANEMGFLAGFSDRSMFTIVNQNNDYVCIPEPGMSGFPNLLSPSKVLTKTKVITPWWANSIKTESGVEKVAYYAGSEEDHTVPSGGNNTPGVVAVFMIG